MSKQTPQKKDASEYASALKELAQRAKAIETKLSIGDEREAVKQARFIRNVLKEIARDIENA